MNMVREVSFAHLKINILFILPTTTLISSHAVLTVISQFFQDKGTSEVNPFVRYGAILSLAVTLSAVIYRGLNTVGRTSCFMYLLTMGPFLIMVIVGLSKGEFI
jgi:amino acid transporter